MRQFFIRDGAGKQYGLNGEALVWLLNPTGLGVSFANKYSDIKQGFFAPLNADEWQTQSIVCDFGIIEPAYQTFRSFIDWMVTAEELVIVYQPFGSEKFYRKVKLDYLEKTELFNGIWLRCPASFTCLTPWYKPTTLTVEIADESAGAMEYTFTYDNDLVYSSDYNGAYGVELTPSGHLPAAITLEYTGAITNPVIVLEGKSSGKEYGRCAVNKAASSSLSFSSLYADSYCMVDGDDASDYISPAYDPFFHLPLTEPCVLKILSSASFSGTAEASIYYYYRSV